MIWGWGTKVRKWLLGEDQMLVATWKYFHIFWFPAAGAIHWHVMNDKRSEDKEISYDEVKKLVPVNPPEISIWQRYGLYFLIGGLILLGFWGSF